MKTCSRCRKDKPVDEFYVRRDKPANPCKACVLEINNRWYLEHRGERHRRMVIRARAKRLGMTYEEYVAAGDPGTHCAICDAPPDSRRNGSWGNGTKTAAKRLAIDHSHASGQLRGFLCGNCNRALGLADDSPELLRKMADYLERGAEMAPFGSYRPAPKECTVEDCGRQVSGRGLCGKHEARLRVRGTTEDRPTRFCSIEGCARKHYGAGYCRRHWQHFRAHGDPQAGRHLVREAAPTCENCGAEFDPYRSAQRFCSVKCRNAWHHASKVAIT